MEKQLIISVGREFGSGGHVIAEALAKEFQIPLWDRNLLKQIAEEKHVNQESLKKFDEKQKNVFLSRTVKGYSSSPQEQLARLQFDFLIKRANQGESFVVVGRCAETILKDFEGLVSIFVLGNKECKQERIQEVYQVSKDEALHMMEKNDKARKSYHNSYCESKWGDSRSYDICMNSSKLGVEGTAKILAEYIRARRKENI